MEKGKKLMKKETRRMKYRAQNEAYRKGLFRNIVEGPNI